jgi:hypothetical protein
MEQDNAAKAVFAILQIVLGSDLTADLQKSPRRMKAGEHAIGK